MTLHIFMRFVQMRKEHFKFLFYQTKHLLNTQYLQYLQYLDLRAKGGLAFAALPGCVLAPFFDEAVTTMLATCGCFHCDV